MIVYLKEDIIDKSIILQMAEAMKSANARKAVKHLDKDFDIISSIFNCVLC